jgi:hypothetical protein
MRPSSRAKLGRFPGLPSTRKESLILQAQKEGQTLSVKRCGGAPHLAVFETWDTRDLRSGRRTAALKDLVDCFFVEVVR